MNNILPLTPTLSLLHHLTPTPSGLASAIAAAQSGELVVVGADAPLASAGSSSRTGAKASGSGGSGSEGR